MEEALKVLVVDDSVIYRKVVTDLLSSMPGVEVVGSAPNGRLAVQKIDLLAPDLLLLDLEMPELDGLGVLRHLSGLPREIGAIMLSAFTAEGAQATVAALAAGAFDFATKPTGNNPAESREMLDRQLRPKLTAYARRKGIRRILQPGPAEARPAAPRPATPAAPRNVVYPPRHGRVEAVVLGISTGGPKALTEMLPRLPADLPVPVLLVQHMPPVFTRSLADDLNGRCKLRVCEASEGQEVTAGRVYIAPGGKQMGVARTAGGTAIRITDDPPENSCRPAVDYLFRSAVGAWGGDLLGVIMTGMGNDGLVGCRLLKQRGATVLCQDEASCVVYGMPRGVAEEGLADVISPLAMISGEIDRLARGRLAACR